MNVKILRLKDGEDIISDFNIEDNNTVLLNNPMTLFFKRVSGGKSIVMMAPWLPVELVAHNTAKIHGNEVLTIVEPKTSLIEYYVNAVTESETMLDEYGDVIDEALANGETTMLDELDINDDEDKFLEDMQQSFKTTSKKQLH